MSQNCHKSQSGEGHTCHLIKFGNKWTKNPESIMEKVKSQDCHTCQKITFKNQHKILDTFWGKLNLRIRTFAKFEKGKEGQTSGWLNASQQISFYKKSAALHLHVLTFWRWRPPPICMWRTIKISASWRIDLDEKSCLRNKHSSGFCRRLIRLSSALYLLLLYNNYCQLTVSQVAEQKVATAPIWNQPQV